MGNSGALLRANNFKMYIASIRTSKLYSKKMLFIQGYKFPGKL